MRQLHTQLRPAPHRQRQCQQEAHEQPKPCGTAMFVMRVTASFVVPLKDDCKHSQHQEDEQHRCHIERDDARAACDKRFISGADTPCVRKQLQPSTTHQQQDQKQQEGKPPAPLTVGFLPLNRPLRWDHDASAAAGSVMSTTVP
jgi:hypothetical protein